MQDCLFCKMAAGDIPVSKVYEDDTVLAFHDIDPQAPVHFLVIPKTHIASPGGITPENSAVVAHIFEVIARLAEEAPGLWQDLLVYVGNVLRLMCYDAREQTIRDVTTRLIHFLLLYTQGKEVPEVDCSQQQIASAINASRVQVTRVCARLQAQGLIRIRRGHIRILDPETLEQLSERGEAGERE